MTASAREVPSASSEARGAPPVRPETVRLLVVDDEAGQAAAIEEGLSRVGYDCEVTHSGAEAIEALSRARYDLVVTDLVLRDRDGIEVLREAKRRDATVSVLILTGHGSVELAVRAMKEGAFDFLEKPVQLEALRVSVARELESRALRHEVADLRRALDRRYGFEEFVGHSPAMEKVLDTVAQVAPTNATVLVLGETGTGKELVARAIHRHSPRREGRFVAVNAAGLAETLIESELFGHEKGAFTGAVASKQGWIEVADGGTLLLDEIGDMPLSTQAKLLRVLEQKALVRVGATTPIRVDVRFVAATNLDLERKIEKGEFRKDLFFRLAVVKIQLPALRERPEDVPLLLDHFLRVFTAEHGRKPPAVDPAARTALQRYSWPGNVRELRNVVESLIATRGGKGIRIEDLPAPIADRPPEEAAGHANWLAGRPLAELEREAIRSTLQLVRGNRQQCAAMLGIGERTLYRKLKEYGFS
ncbi:MAG TPA: sigma-54 dependent transcriptional regulator [Planctomycetota bacterium]|nr:sigma-54 dependent transcriptional regulator [Planctomycetota bacterium]